MADTAEPTTSTGWHFADVYETIAAAFQRAVAAATPRRHVPTTVAVARHLATVGGSQVADAARAASDEMSWIATPRLVDDLGADVGLGSNDLVYNHPGDRHGAIAGDEPLLALYVLW